MAYVTEWHFQFSFKSTNDHFIEAQFVLMLCSVTIAMSLVTGVWLTDYRIDLTATLYSLAC
jgi:hypothetical protein